MKYWVTCSADVEKYVSDERLRPCNYKEHFYPCYIESAESWDSHFCSDFYFKNKSREEAIAMRKANLVAYINEKSRQIENAKNALDELNEY